MRNYYAFFLILCLIVGVYQPVLAQKPGQQYFIEGENMRKQNRCKDAIVKYNDAIKAEPSNYKYYFAKGKCEYKLKDYENAKESFKFTVDYRQDYSPAYSLLAKIYRKEAATNKDAIGEAIYYYEQAAKYEKNDSRKATYLMLLVNLLLKEDRAYDARRYLEDAREINPDNPQILYYTAEIAASDEDWQSARRDYERALETDRLQDASPAEKAKYYYGLGLACSKMGDNASAQKYWAKANFGPYKRMIQQHMMETSHVHFYKIAISYYLSGEYDESDRYLDKALELQNDFSRAYILRGKIEQKRGNLPRAVDYLERALEVEQDAKQKSRMYGMVASLQLKNNDSYGALTSLERALEGSPGSTKLMYMLAKAEYGAGRFSDASATLDKLLSASPDSKSKARYSFLKGMAARRAGDDEGAIAAFKNAMYGPYKYAAKVELEKLSANVGKGR